MHFKHTHTSPTGVLHFMPLQLSIRLATPPTPHDPIGQTDPLPTAMAACLINSLINLLPIILQKATAKIV